MMNMEISNKTLAWLVVATIVVSLAGTLISVNRIGQGVTGFASYVNATGNATVSISSQTSLSFVVAGLNFGSGSIDGNAPYYCNLSVNKSAVYNGSTAGTGSCIGFNTMQPSNTLILENTGNTYMNITLNFSADATIFPGGSIVTPAFQFSVEPNETFACAGGMNTSVASFVNVVANVPYPVCYSGGLGYISTNDSLAIGIRISIPSDASGGKNVTIRAVGTAQ
jgi:hypothetical protein